jgi:hypothetical protein
MLTFPVTETVEVPAARVPVPLMVSVLCAVRALFEVVRDAPVEIVNAPAAVSWLNWLRVPEMVTAAKDCEGVILIVLAAPVNVAVLDVEVKLPVVTDEVSQLPAMLIVADPKVVFAPVPEEVRFPLNVGVAPVSVSVPAYVRLPVNVVVIPLLTVRL